MAHAATSGGGFRSFSIQRWQSVVIHSSRLSARSNDPFPQEFGSGASAYKLVLASNRLYQRMVEAKIKGVEFKACTQQVRAIH
jgi:hypothetical protein